MITADMRQYDFYLLGALDAYGQNLLSELPQGKIKMSINLISQTTTNNVLYMDAAYIGLTQEAVDESFVIDREGKKLKVLYVFPKGRYHQVFMGEYKE